MKAPWDVAPPLPAEAGSRAWGELLEAMIHAAWLVDGRGLRIVAANTRAALLCGLIEEPLAGRPVLEFAATPEDQAFWSDAAAGLVDAMESDTLIRRADGSLLPVSRRVTPLHAAGPGFYLVALEDRAAERRREAELEGAVASLQATLDSLVDGVLVTDLRGTIRNFNRRFADLWDLPAAMLGARREDDAVLDWMRMRVIDPGRYMRRLAAIDDGGALRASDVLMLHGGRVLERVTAPQMSRDHPVGRVYTFREIRPPRREPGVSH